MWMKNKRVCTHMRKHTKPCCLTFWGVLAATLAMAALLAKFGSEPVTWDFSTNRTKEFKLPFKTLYVFSKCHRSVGGNSTKAVCGSKNGTRMAARREEFSSLREIESFLAVGDRNSEPTDDEFTISKLSPSAKNIFFLESSCAASYSRPWILRDKLQNLTENRMTCKHGQNGSPPLTEKQACSIYSAAHHNPNRKVIFLFTCPVPSGHNWTKQWRILFDLPNFFFGRVDMAELYSNTSLSEFYHGPLAFSNFSVSHQSDIFRQFVLYLYGGTYMDLDVISVKPLENLGFNYVIYEGEGSVTAGVWNFEPNHPFLRGTLLQGTTHYEPFTWSVIGPALFTMTLRSLCNISDGLDFDDWVNLASCNIRILPQTTFFSVHYVRWEFFFIPRFWPIVQDMTRGSYGIHYWNHRANLSLYTGSNQAVVKFAEQNCPPVYLNAGKFLT